jgi:NADH-quinone oxidoreductase subunit N
MPLFANSMSSLYLFLVLYLLSVTGFFSFFMMLRRQGTNKLIIKISELNNLFQSSPSLAIASSILLFSIAGIPPLAGFFGKFYIFISVFNEVPSLILFALLFSCISTFYYIRIIK